MKHLVVAGTGIKAYSHLTNEVSYAIEKAHKVLYLVNEPVIAEWIQKNSKSSEDLEKIYFSSNDRSTSYKSLTEKIVSELEHYDELIVIFYGHPCVFAKSALDAVHIARKKNYKTTVMPGISAEDCLYADLLIDPGTSGCQSFEATDFLLYQRQYDPRAHLILWQIGILGKKSFDRSTLNLKCIDLLTEYLRINYSSEHTVCLYEATQYPGIASKITYVVLNQLVNAPLSTITTLYIPPLKTADSEQNQKVLNALSL